MSNRNRKRSTQVELGPEVFVLGFERAKGGGWRLIEGRMPMGVLKQYAHKEHLAEHLPIVAARVAGVIEAEAQRG